LVALLGLGLVLGACSFNGRVDNLSNGSDADPLAPDADPNAADANAGNGDADIADPADGAPPPSPLVDTDLVVRYFMDEASTGKAPTQLEDSAPNPMALPITYGQASYAENQGHRGLQWASAGGDGKAHKNYSGTKLITRLNPSSKVTIEVVIEIENAIGDSGSQIAGVRGGNPDFMLTASGNDSLRFYRPYGTHSATWSGVHSQERMVLHLVYDTSQPDQGERVKLYKNGVLLPKTDISPPTQNSSFSMGSSDALAIGNKPGGTADESLEGTIYYVALYDNALSLGDVQNNAARLLVSDDE
jgi:hypothetical protein